MTRNAAAIFKKRGACQHENDAEEAVDLVIGDVDVTVAKWHNPDAKLGENFPAPEEGVLHLVSRPAAAAAWKDGRTDICCPGVAVRNAEGQQIGCIGVAFS